MPAPKRLNAPEEEAAAAASSHPPLKPAARRHVVFEQAPPHVGHRILLYGPGGIGKTSLADLAPGPVVSVDLDDSLGVLQPAHTQRVAGIANWNDLHEMLLGEGWKSVRTLVIDSATKAEELAVAHTLKNVLTEKGAQPTSIEGYGYGKGYQHVYETWLPLLEDLDTHVHAGRNVILICHDCMASVPNPQGEDWLRSEPRLQSPSSGKASIRLRTKEWADHVFFLNYDVNVSDKGKAQGSGTRTLYPAEMPWYMAKSRRLTKEIVIEPGSAAIWEALFGLPAERTE
jgi:hypothetical protein